MLTGEGQYSAGDTATITAMVKQGMNYVFDKWINVNNASDVIYSPVHSFPVNSNITYKAIFKPLAQYSVSVSTNSSQYGETSISPVQSKYDYGSQVVLTANARPGSEFICWEENGREISRSSNYTFTVNGTHNLKAIFAPKETGKHKVIFKDAEGRVLKVELVENNQSATLPEAPSKAGYEFIGWDKSSGNITQDEVITAKYRQSDKTYTVNVYQGIIDGTEGSSSGNCKFDSHVTVVANAAPVGQKFSHWLKNGKISGYNLEYSFYVSENTEMAAAFVPDNTTIQVLPCITIDTAPIVKNDEISFIAQCTFDGTVYNEESIVEYGILLSQYDNPDLGTENVIRVRARSKTSTGQFMITKTNVSADQIWHGRAYMTYKGIDGTLITIYSNTVMSQ